MSKGLEVVVLGYARTPFGSFQGSLASFKAPALGSFAIRAALERAQIKSDQVGEVILGNVLTAGAGQAPARQASLGAGLSPSVPALTINKVCGSGMKAVMLAAQSIALGDSEVVVAGGMESMSQAPYLSGSARQGFRMGDQTFVDSMIYDGLWDPYNNQHMGQCGELCAREKSFTREVQDQFAIESFKLALAAQKEGKLGKEIAPVTVSLSKTETKEIREDEGPSKVNFDKIPKLKPVFDPKGSVTAANASSINDGAAVLILSSAEKAKKLGLRPLAKIVSYATYSQKPEWFTTAPAPAMKDAIQKAGWKLPEIDSFEINEAFAVVTLATQRELGIPREKINRWGGAISLGHPIGASGARITLTLVSQFQQLGLKRGVAGICIGGGEATAICLEAC